MSEQRAYIDQDHQVLGQVLVNQSFVLASLHVIDKMTPSPLILLDQRGNLENVIFSEVLAIDFAADMILFRSTLSANTRRTICLASVESIGIDVEVHAIGSMNLLSKSESRMKIFPSKIRDIVEVECHSYPTASGYITSARNLRVIFLSDPFPKGWSGAPVYLSGTCNILGFIHGNAPANSGDGVCLLPNSGNTLLEMYFGGMHEAGDGR